MVAINDASSVNLLVINTYNSPSLVLKVWTLIPSAEDLAQHEHDQIEYSTLLSQSLANYFTCGSRPIIKLTSPVKIRKRYFGAQYNMIIILVYYRGLPYIPAHHQI
jgi:hypothetical protein